MLILLISLLLSAFVTPVMSEDIPGIPIHNCNELQGIGTTTGPVNADYIQMNEINCSNIDNFMPIGNRMNSFIGRYNGQNYPIKYLNIDRGITEVGLFGHVSNATLENIVLSNVSIEGRYHGGYVGALVGTAIDSIVRNSHVREGQVRGNNILGGLIGSIYFNGGVYHSSSSVGVFGTNDGYILGGLIGQSYVEVLSCHATGNVTSTFADLIGGLIGSSHRLVKNSYATGDVYSGSRGTRPSFVGGLVGFSAGDIENSHAMGNVSFVEYDASVGGLVGLLLPYTSIESSYAIGNVEGGTSTGGLVGTWERESQGTISNSYAHGSVIGNETTGGLIGKATDNHLSTVINSYATGFVDSPSQSGGLIGNGDMFVVDSYWDIETTNQTTSFGGEPRTTAQMQLKDASVPTYVNWSDNIWVFETGQYPILYYPE